LPLCADCARPRPCSAATAFLELSPLVLGRALEPFPESVRTLDALHLASVDFLRGRRLAPRLATYDRRIATVAQAMTIPLAALARAGLRG
jgi:hypothetical protein